MGQLTLVVGGVRSGKSRWAEQRAAAYPPVIYLATAQAGDTEMAGRITQHQQRRAQYGPSWQTIEEPWAVVPALQSHPEAGCMLVECLTLWLTNLMVGLPGRAARTDADILAEVTALAEACQAAGPRIIVVSNEVGCGIMPANALARRFSDLLGEANQRLATAADEVYAFLAGIPVRIK